MNSLLREPTRRPVPIDRRPEPKTGCVLIVDDDRGVREMFRRSLELAHFDVVLATGGEDGMRMLREDPSISLILLDLIMPGMDGRAFRAAQLAEERLADIPTVVVTGSPLAHIVHAELMALDYLLKPVAREHLVSVVARYCKPVVSPSSAPSGARA